VRGGSAEAAALARPLSAGFDQPAGPTRTLRGTGRARPLSTGSTSPPAPHTAAGAEPATLARTASRLSSRRR
jgi:hypothetical protein